MSSVRRSATGARTAAVNQIGDVVVTAPDKLRSQLEALGTNALIRKCAGLRPGSAGDPVLAETKRALRILARRYKALTAEITDLDTRLRRLCAQANPALLSTHGVGPETAACLLIAAGDNPDRMRNDASFAALCGASPVEASSGRIVRHRLNRGGNRQANNALWRIAMVRLSTDERTKAYAERRKAEGKTPRETLRCPRALHRPRGLQTAHQPAGRPRRQQPAQPAHHLRPHPHRHRHRPQHHPHPPLRTRTRPQTQPRPRRTLPTPPHTPPRKFSKLRLSSIGASKPIIARMVERRSHPGSSMEARR